MQCLLTGRQLCATYPAVVLGLADRRTGAEGFGPFHNGARGGLPQLLVGPLPTNQRRLDEDALCIGLLVHILTGLDGEEEGVLKRDARSDS
jgi:hypothetical protein